MLVELTQPPSGGCELKHLNTFQQSLIDGPAAFGRLRVETSSHSSAVFCVKPAAFGRLRVETALWSKSEPNSSPAAFGRLRVETEQLGGIPDDAIPAAFGRLRVETLSCVVLGTFTIPSRLRAAAS